MAGNRTELAGLAFPGEEPGGEGLTLMRIGDVEMLSEASWLVLRFFGGGFPSCRRFRETALMDSRMPGAPCELIASMV